LNEDSADMEKWCLFNDNCLYIRADKIRTFNAAAMNNILKPIYPRTYFSLLEKYLKQK
jgi:hypothetical protein